MGLGLNSLPPRLVARRFCRGCAGRSAARRAPLGANPKRPVLRDGTGLRLPRSRILKKADQQEFRSLEGALNVALELRERCWRAAPVQAQGEG